MDRTALSREATTAFYVLGLCALLAYVESAAAAETGTTISLDGDRWLLATDPQNVGRVQSWFKTPRPEARPTRVPWIIQDVFPDYHGVAWYWREFTPPVNPHPRGRYFLRFWAVDYLADVWVNGVHIGQHEGGETPFTLDATDAIRAGDRNLLAVRVLNPSEEPIDGIVLSETPHRNKKSEFACGSDYNHGGIEDSVELLVSPAIHVQDLFVRANPETATISIRTTVQNTKSNPAAGTIEWTVAPAAGGSTIAHHRVAASFAPGETTVDAKLKVDDARLWDLDDPYLYRVTARACVDDSSSIEERSTRVGFRDFRLSAGYFRLNGRRMLLRSSVSGNMSPIGIHVPYDEDWLRRDLINVKAMGFNAVRFYGLPTRFQLDLCDEIGLLVAEEPYSSQLFKNSPEMTERFDTCTREMILRDRNHPSVVIWGLLNETGDGPQFRHAVQALSLVRSVDDSRMVLLSSGRFDGDLSVGSVSNPGSHEWEYLLGDEQPGAPTTSATSVPAYMQGVGDVHAYPFVPHTSAEIQFLRTLGGNTKPVYLSEYGIASAVDLTRVVRNYEQRGKGESGECRFYRQALERFMNDWNRWHLADTFGRPEDYFAACLKAMSRERLIGINAVRANPHIIGYSLTGTVDQGYTGEGLTTVFREPKPGTMDAIFDGLAPLRWCLFAEPAGVYRGKNIKLEAVLANEDVLPEGEYPVCLEVFGPDGTRVFRRTASIRIGGSHNDPEPPLATPVWSEEVCADWPAGTYRFVAAFQRGAAAAGGSAEFQVLDESAEPQVHSPVVLWGKDDLLRRWLIKRGIALREFDSSPATERELYLVSATAPAEGEVSAFRELASRVARGSSAVFLDPNIFAAANNPGSLSPIGRKGTLIPLPNNVYHKDDWVKQHPIFAGLPAGGLLVQPCYRELASNLAWSRSDAPVEAVAGAIYAFTGYKSGLTISVDQVGSGKLVLNTLRIRDNLDRNPAADRLLLNMLLYAAPVTSKELDSLPADFEARFESQEL